MWSVLTWRPSNSRIHFLFKCLQNLSQGGLQAGIYNTYQPTQRNWDHVEHTFRSQAEKSVYFPVAPPLNLFIVCYAPFLLPRVWGTLLGELQGRFQSGMGLFSPRTTKGWEDWTLHFLKPSGIFSFLLENFMIPPCLTGTFLYEIRGGWEGPIPCYWGWACIMDGI